MFHILTAAVLYSPNEILKRFYFFLIFLLLKEDTEWGLPSLPNIGEYNNLVLQK